MFRRPPSSTFFPYAPLFRSAPRGSAVLCFAVFGGSVAWFVSLSVGYFGVHEACAHQTAVLPRLVSLLALVFALAAAVAAWDRKSTRLYSTYIVTSYAVFRLN